MARHSEAPLKGPNIALAGNPALAPVAQAEGYSVRGSGHRSTVNGDPVRDLRCSKPKGRVGVALPAPP